MTWKGSRSSRGLETNLVSWHLSKWRWPWAQWDIALPLTESQLLWIWRAHLSLLHVIFTVLKFSPNSILSINIYWLSPMFKIFPELGGQWWITQSHKCPYIHDTVKWEKQALHKQPNRLKIIIVIYGMLLWKIFRYSTWGSSFYIPSPHLKELSIIIAILWQPVKPHFELQVEDLYFPIFSLPFPVNLHSFDPVKF